MCPSELLFRRKVRSKLPEVIDNLMPDEDEVRQAVTESLKEHIMWIEGVMLKFLKSLLVTEFYCSKIANTSCLQHTSLRSTQLLLSQDAK